MMKTKLIFLVVTLGLFMACSQDDSPKVVEPDPIQKPDPEPENSAPTANAGDDQIVEIGSLVQLDGTGSTDSDGDVLTYKWSFVDRPEGSTTTINGVGKESAEFTFDKAGIYELKLELSDGETKTSDLVLIRNKTPILTRVNTRAPFNLSDEFAKIGNSIYVYGNFFSPEILENKIAINGVDYEIHELYINPKGSGEDFIRIEVPESAVSGELVFSVGNESNTWPVPIRIVSVPVDAFIDGNEHLERQERSSYGTGDFEIGTRFRPLVDGKLIGVTLSLPITGDFKVTLWDAVNRIAITSTTLSDINGFEVKILSDPIPLEKDQVYMITVNAPDWYLFIDEQDPVGEQFPQTFENIELLNTGFHPGPDTNYADEGSPTHYITKGVDFIFATDPQ